MEQGVHTHLFSHKPQMPDLEEPTKHGFHKASELLLRFPEADLGYTDGSHVHWDHSGCAAALDHFGEGGTPVRSVRVRESSSYPADLWALYLVLTYARPSTTLIILSDYSSALQKKAAIEQDRCPF